MGHFEMTLGGGMTVRGKSADEEDRADGASAFWSKWKTAQL